MTRHWNLIRTSRYISVPILLKYLFILRYGILFKENDDTLPARDQCKPVNKPVKRSTEAGTDQKNRQENP